MPMPEWELPAAPEQPCPPVQLQMLMPTQQEDQPQPCTLRGQVAAAVWEAAAVAQAASSRVADSSLQGLLLVMTVKETEVPDFAGAADADNQAKPDEVVHLPTHCGTVTKRVLARRSSQLELEQHSCRGSPQGQE